MLHSGALRPVRAFAGMAAMHERAKLQLDTELVDLPRSTQQARTREKVQAFIRSIADKTGDSIQTMSQRSGVGKSTIHRWMEKKGTINPTLDKLQQIADAYGVSNPFASDPSAVQALAAMQEPEAEPYKGPLLSQEIGALTADQSYWEISTRALELAGYMPGDILKIDMRLKPRQGDAVIAQIYDGYGNAETVFRIFSDPYLIARSFDPDLVDNPILVRPRDVKIVGVVTASLRVRTQ